MYRDVMIDWGLILRKSADKDMKNHYIISNKTSKNNDKSTYKSRFVTIRKSISYKVVK